MDIWLGIGFLGYSSTPQFDASLGHVRRGDIVHRLVGREKSRSMTRTRGTCALAFPRIFPAHLATENTPLERTVHRAAGEQIFFVSDASPGNQCGALSRHTDRPSQSIHLAARFHSCWPAKRRS